MVVALLSPAPYPTPKIFTQITRDGWRRVFSQDKQSQIHPTSNATVMMSSSSIQNFIGIYPLRFQYGAPKTVVPRLAVRGDGSFYRQSGLSKNEHACARSGTQY
ncbi:hypothetical protein OK016_19825 [Vibrio chagasii]|nr:hypothetical protein [Vibrio chagasii]